MTPAQARAWLDGLEIIGMRFGLDRMRLVLAALGDPQLHHPCVHVVGTNGKTSTTHMTAALLGAHGLRTGTYTSPHITDWPERVRVDDSPVDWDVFADALTRVRDAADGLNLAADDRVTQFEVLTAAGFVAHARAGVDAAVIEAGLGGRWDATNVLGGRGVVVLTNIALEHTALLGDTVRAIAGEKLAVAADGSRRLVVGRMEPEAARAVDGVMASRGLEGWRLGREFDVRDAPDGLVVECAGEAYDAIALGAAGAFQRDNAAVAVAAARRFLGRPLDPSAVRRTLAHVRIAGRMEVVPGAPRIILDGAHNPAGMAALMGALPDGVRPVAVVSVLDDKDAAAMIGPLAARCAAIITTRSAHRRAADPAALAALAGAEGGVARAVPGPPEALRVARAMAGPEGTVLVCGSLYLLADLRPLVTTAG